MRAIRAPCSMRFARSTSRVARRRARRARSDEARLNVPAHFIAVGDVMVDVTASARVMARGSASHPAVLQSMRRSGQRSPALTQRSSAVSVTTSAAALSVRSSRRAASARIFRSTSRRRPGPFSSSTARFAPIAVRTRASRQTICPTNSRRTSCSSPATCPADGGEGAGAGRGNVARACTRAARSAPARSERDSRRRRRGPADHGLGA